MSKERLTRDKGREGATSPVVFSTENSPTTPSLLTLAWRIWSAGGTPVLLDDAAMHAELEPALRDWVLVEDEKGLRFASDLYMVQAAAEYIFQTESTLLTSTPKACFERLDEIWGKEIGKKDMVSGHILALLHNGGHIDAYSWGRQAIEAGVCTFDVLNVLEGAVVHFQNAHVESIFHFFSGHYESVKNDLRGGLLYPKLQDWFAQHPDAAREVKRLHEEQPKECSAGLYACALHGLILNDFPSGFALMAASSRSPNPLIARPAVHILGLADYSEPSRRAALNETIQICAMILRTPGHRLLGTAVGTLSRLLTLDEDVIVALLDEASKTMEPEVLYALSEFLWKEEKSLSGKDWFWPLLQPLTSAKPEQKDILTNIDLMLMGWVRDPVKMLRAIEFMNTWISKQPNDAFNEGGLEASFSSTIPRLVEQPTTFSRALTEWLLHDDSRYPLIAHKLLSRLRTERCDAFELATAIIDELTQDELRFLLRRILGYIVGDKIQISLVFSLVHTRDAKDRTFGYVASVLQDQIGYDYPYQTIEYLKERQGAENETEKVKALCGEIVTELQGRLDAIDALPDLKEFRPSSVKMRRFSKERQRKINEAVEEASKDSIWRQITTHIPLKAGRRTFQTFNGVYTDPMELKEMSYSAPLPRSEVSDPAGAARERLLCRMAKRDSP